MTEVANRPRVFFPQESPRFRTADAEAFGRRVFLLPVTVNPMDCTGAAVKMSAELDTYRFDPATDYAVMTGDSRMLALFFAVIAARCTGVIKTLFFDAKASRYVERDLELDKLHVCPNVVS